MGNKYCVYMHITPSNKVYIGQTSDVTRRWSCNGYEYKHSPYFYQAIQKYGWENIQHIVLYENLTKEQADTREQELIAQYNSTNKENGYNMNPGGTGGNNKPLKPINMYSMDCEYLQNFESAADACRFLGFPTSCRGAINLCCLKQQKSSHGYRWAFQDEALDIDYINYNFRSENNTHNKKISVTDIITKNTKTFCSIQSAVRYYNWSISGFSWYRNKSMMKKPYLNRYIIKIQEGKENGENGSCKS